MLILISPAKTLDFESQTILDVASKPEFLAQSKKLIAQLRVLTPAQIKKMMGISDKLTSEVHQYFADWKAKYDSKAAKQALLAFRGDVYLGLDADSFAARDFEFAQQHLRILSGLYGSLRPFDLIQPYRLEMGTKLKGDYGKDLYEFWGDRIAKSLQAGLAEQGDDVLVNLASNEYFKAARAKGIDGRVITPIFQDRNPKGEYKVMSFFAKKARGMMARYLIRERVRDEAGLLEFRDAGYKYHRGLSSENKPVFTRNRAPAA
ncbi:MAG: peroxide stress protein YaaA [Planctomycetota bacterium]